MNDTSIVTRSTGCGTSAVVSDRALTAFVDRDARIGAQPPVELSASDVERDHVSGAALQQDVGEAAGRGADVERTLAGRIDAEGVERVRQLDAAAADVRMIRHRDFNPRVRGDGRRRLSRSPDRPPSPGRP